MSARVLVLYPARAPAPCTQSEMVHPVAYSQAADIDRALREATAPAAILWSDGLPAAEIEAAARAVRESGVSVIEVRNDRWDGESLSPLSAACRGVISGFGAAGVAAALDLLAREAAARGT